MSQAYTALIEAFLDGRMNLAVPGAHLYLQKGVLYSYGPHYPLARWKEGQVWVTIGTSTHTTSKQRKRLTDALAARGKAPVTVTLEEMQMSLKEDGKDLSA